MQQFISSVEAQALLDRILQTSQSLNRAIAQLAAPVVETRIVPPPVTEEASLSSVEEAKVEVLPLPPRTVAPALTIKLADLVRESTRAQQRHRQTLHPKPQPRPIPIRKRGKEVEVLIRRSFRMVS
jgi:hypothetical protein